MRVTKNYTTDGGDRTVIGGILDIDGGTVMKDGQEISLGGGNQTEMGAGSVTHEMLQDKSVRSNNIGTGSVMEEHLNSAITERLSSLENRLKALETAKTEPAATE
ncbi:hypothetical protein CJZ71_08070 [Bacillus subtilis]|uniref:hypothetical protein n=1 Tax=Bacillus TaxID=1386 RepID=UPI00045F6617|nr:MULTISPECIES: hypothetical protein [Bacillus]MCY8064344.1 hypothetical protein [Bacillus spizizenii]AMK73800.1 hypothetical protein AWV81_17540 [Bacillus subtilis subsp. natto]AOR99691.1 hypothetical protein BSBS38_03439 [Bacillus subtilis]AOS69442.1 hypothetical protein A4A60_18105 [Bacillus subtilis]API43512.1 hypothetical protein BSR08_13875 [Bacillus subtilis]